MRITFTNSNPQTVKQANAAYSSDAPKAKGIGSSYDISKTLDNNRTYEGSKKSVNDIKSMAESTDVELTKNYMAVMSGCMSEEDFGKLVESGENPGSVKVEDAVTIIDRIKLEVAKSGKAVEGFTDTLDDETVKEMTGMESLASISREADITLDEDTLEEIKSALDKLSEIEEMTDGMKKFMVVNELEPTIENLYIAKHSVLSDVKEQGSEYFYVEAKGYLAKKGNEIDEKDLEKELRDLLGSLKIETSDNNVTTAKWLVENSICVEEKNMDRLEKLNSLSFPISEEKLAKAVAAGLSEGKEIEKADLTREESIYDEAVRITNEIERIIDEPFVKETRILEETRLKMTFEANLLLAKSDYHIDTKDLESYVEKLKELEASQAYKEVKSCVEVKETIEEVKKLPAAIIAPVAKRISEVSLSEVLKEGMPVKVKYNQAFEKYEQVQTEVRRDLGDSIKKAFRNVPDILAELGMEGSGENERAVRILGYNSMEITKESIETIKEADKKLNQVISRLSPSDTLELIREGRSPIEMSVEELNDYLDKKHDTKEEEIEKYSKFLYKLESNKEILPEERKQYIEVYRFFHQLDKTGGAALGSVLNASKELTIPNLREALKTAKHRGLDISVGDMYEKLSGSEKGVEENSWLAHKYGELKEALKAPEEIVTELVMNNVPVTAENLEAALLLRKQRGRAMDSATRADAESAKDTLLNITSEFESREEAIEGYAEAISKAKEAVFNECMGKDSYLDVRALQLVHMQLSVSKAYSECENYEVPMEIGGKVTSVNVKLVHNKDMEGSVVVSLETDELGRVSARFTSEKGEIAGYIACNFKETVTEMKKVADKLSTKVSVVWSETSDTDLTLSRIPMKDNDEASSYELYKIAGKFLEGMKG